MERHRIRDNIPTLLITEASEGWHEAFKIAIRHYDVPLRKGGWSRDLWQAKCGHSDTQLNPLFTIPQACITMAWCTFLHINGRAIFNTRCLRGNQRTQSWRGCGCYIIGRGSDIFSQCEVAGSADNC